MQPLFHFSEDPSITLFRPRVAPTSTEDEAFVWAVDLDRAPIYWVTREDICPLSVTPVGDLISRHAEAGIELRIVQNLWPMIDAIVASGLEFSIIRKVNAQPRRIEVAEG